MISAHNEGVAVSVAVGPPGYNGQFHIPGDNGSQGSTFHTHPGCTEVTENQDVVQPQVYQHRSHAADHGYHGFTGFPEGAGIGIGQGEGEKTPEHDQKIRHAVAQSIGGGGRVTLTGEIQSNQCVAAQQEDAQADCRKQQTDENLKAKGVADTLTVSGAVELGCKNSGTGGGAENTQIKDSQQHIDNGNAAHRHGAYLTDHNVVQ